MAKVGCQCLNWWLAARIIQFKTRPLGSARSCREKRRFCSTAVTKDRQRVELVAVSDATKHQAMNPPVSWVQIEMPRTLLAGASPPAGKHRQRYCRANHDDHYQAPARPWQSIADQPPGI